MHKWWLILLFLSGCGGSQPSEEALPSEPDEYEIIAQRAIEYAETLKNNPLNLMDKTVAKNCTGACLSRSLETASLDLNEAIQSASLGELSFEAQHIKYYSDTQVEILLHGIDPKNKALALMLNLSFIENHWRLDLSHYLDR